MLFDLASDEGWVSGTYKESLELARILAVLNENAAALASDPEVLRARAETGLSAPTTSDIDVGFREATENGAVIVEIEVCAKDRLDVTRRLRFDDDGNLLEVSEKRVSSCLLFKQSPGE